MSATNNWNNMLSFIWSVKEDLRGPYKSHQYGQVILPMVVLRRLDGALSTEDPRHKGSTRKQSVLERIKKLTPPFDNHKDLLKRVAGLEFYNTSRYDFGSLLGDEEAVLENVVDYLNGFSPEVREIIAAFDLYSNVEKLARAERLYSVLGRFADTKVDLSPSKVSNHDMGYLYEELIREVNALQKEQAGEHFTPRDAVDLLASLVIADSDGLHVDGKVITIYDPTSGTGGLLTAAEAKLTSINKKLRVYLRGQELQEESFAICRSDMLIRGERTAQIKLGDTLKVDHFESDRFDYVVANPPYGTDWKNAEVEVKTEHKARGYAGRFGPGLPSTDDGQMLFLMHMFHKLKRPEEGGGRMAVVLNGSPLFAGSAGSGPSEIRRFFIEQDYLEAIVALPVEMFYNTGIATYIWVVSNVKAPERQGYVQLIDARNSFAKMDRSLGNKRNKFSPSNIKAILQTYENLTDTEVSRVLPNESFGYRAVIVERPLRVSWRMNEDALKLMRANKVLSRVDDSARNQVLELAEGRAGWASGNSNTTDAFIVDLLAPLGRHARTLDAAIRKCLQVRDPSGVLVSSKNGFEPDAQRRETELVPFGVDVEAYFRAEVAPYAPDAWIADGKEKIGYEIPITKIFYKYTPPRPSHVIDAEIRDSQRRILRLLQGGEE